MQSVHQNFIKHKLGLLNLVAELGNVSKACKMMGLSRIFSLRRKQLGERLATVELRLCKDNSWELTQVQGIGNTKPNLANKAEKKAMAQLLRLIQQWYSRKTSSG